MKYRYNVLAGRELIAAADYYERANAGLGAEFLDEVDRGILLAQFGHELRRPHADILRDGIYELRERGRVQYRILYFFHGRNVALLAHALTKEDKVPAADLKRAIERKKKYEQNPTQHTSHQPTPQDAHDLQRP